LALLIAQLVRDLAWAAFTAIVTIAINDQGLLPALESAHADADLAASAVQACTSGMGLGDQLDRLVPANGAGQPSASSEQLTSKFFATPARLPCPHWLSHCAAAPS